MRWRKIGNALSSVQLLDNIENKMKDTVVEVSYIIYACVYTAIVHAVWSLSILHSVLLSQGTIPGLFEGKMEVGSMWGRHGLAGLTCRISV